MTKSLMLKAARLAIQIHGITLAFMGEGELLVCSRATWLKAYPGNYRGFVWASRHHLRAQKHPLYNNVTLIKHQLCR